jgi:hypothetical protein
MAIRNYNQQCKKIGIGNDRNSAGATSQLNKNEGKEKGDFFLEQVQGNALCIALLFLSVAHFS